jgi:hypothetical protein
MFWVIALVVIVVVCTLAFGWDLRVRRRGGSPPSGDLPDEPLPWEWRER